MKKKGATIIGAPIFFAIMLFMISMLSIFLINLVMPIVYYQKIENVATKYIFVIEKFGYLTIEEKECLLNELRRAGLQKERIIIKCPYEIKEYGEPIELVIKYYYKSKIPKILYTTFNLKEEETIISVRKNSFSKVY